MNMIQTKKSRANITLMPLNSIFEADDRNTKKKFQPIHVIIFRLQNQTGGCAVNPQEKGKPSQAGSKSESSPGGSKLRSPVKRAQNQSLVKVAKN